MLSITVIVIIVAVSGLVNVTLVNVTTGEQQLLNTMIVGADQLSKGITSATWHAMLDDHREAAYQVMQTIALKQGIDRIRMFNRAGHVMVHCAEHRCAMSLATTVRQIDLKDDAFRAACGARVRRKSGGTQV